MIAAAGAAVQGWQAGDRVTFDSTIYCSTTGTTGAGCSTCATTGGCWESRPASTAGRRLRRVRGCAPAHPLPAAGRRHASSSAAMVEPVSVAFHAVGRTPIAVNDTAVVVGAGMIGLSSCRCCARRAAARSSPSTSSRPSASSRAQLGARRRARPAAGGRVARGAARRTGAAPTWRSRRSASRATVKTAMACVRKGGAVTLVGNCRRPSSSRCRRPSRGSCACTAAAHRRASTRRAWRMIDRRGGRRRRRCAPRSPRWPKAPRGSTGCIAGSRA